MKNILSLFLLLLLGNMTFAQKVIAEESDPRATKMLDKMSQKFESFSSYELDFRVSMTTPDSDEPQVQKGKFIRKGKQYRVIAHDQNIFCDAQNVWIYTPKSNEVQINDADDTGDDFVSPDKLFNLYKTGEYLYRVSREFKDGESKMAEIEFKPIDRMSDFFKVKMVLDKMTNQPKSIKIFYKDGLRVTMSLSGLKKNKAYNKNFFSFDKSKHPDVKIEDLRL